MARRKRARLDYPRRGEVYLVALDPTVGHEIRKTRPAVIVQDDVLNRVGGTTIVAPITSNTRPPIHLTRVLVRAGEGGLSVDSVILARQLRAVDPSRLVRKLGTLRPQTMTQVNRALMLSLGLVDL